MERQIRQFVASGTQARGKIVGDGKPSGHSWRVKMHGGAYAIRRQDIRRPKRLI